MKQFLAFFRLIRWSNLVFIIVTQVLFRYSVIIPVLGLVGLKSKLNSTLFIELVLASILIAAGGYVINDYFDINIDRINKPEKLVLDRVLKRRTAIVWHLFLSLSGILLSFHIGWNAGHHLIPGFCNLLSVLLLLFYSTTYKRKLLSGNLIISFLTSWVILILYLFELPRLFAGNLGSSELEAMGKILRVSILYASFAFIISLVREVLKDAEDMEGDGKNGCRTIPLVWGIRGAKIFVFVWLFMLIIALGFLQFYVFFFHWWASILYSVLFILIPLIRVSLLLKKASNPKDFTSLSQMVKWVMFAGITSLIFFFIYV